MICCMTCCMIAVRFLIANKFHRHALQSRDSAKKNMTDMQEDDDNIIIAACSIYHGFELRAFLV